MFKKSLQEMRERKERLFKKNQPAIFADEKRKLNEDALVELHTQDERRGYTPLTPGGGVVIHHTPSATGIAASAGFVWMDNVAGLSVSAPIDSPRIKYLLK